MPSDEFPELQPFNVIVDEKFTYEGKQDTRLPRVLNVQDTYAKILSGVTIHQRDQTHRDYLYKEISNKLIRMRWSGGSRRMNRITLDSSGSEDDDDDSASEDDSVVGVNSTSEDESGDESGGSGGSSGDESGDESGGSESKVIPMKNYVMAKIEGWWFPAVIVDGPPGKRRGKKSVKLLKTERVDGGPIVIEGLNFKLDDDLPVYEVEEVSRRREFKVLKDSKEILEKKRAERREKGREKNDAGAPDEPASLSRAGKNEPQLRL